jgi:Bacterial Ig-like domain (group 3)
VKRFVLRHVAAGAVSAVLCATGWTAAGLGGTRAEAAVAGPALQAAGRPVPAVPACTEQIQLTETAPTVGYGFENTEEFKVALSGCATNAIMSEGGIYVETEGIRNIPVELCQITSETVLSCSPSPALLPPGGHSVFARFPGALAPQRIAAATSNSVELTVSPATSATALSLSSPSVVYGAEQTENLSVQVSPLGTGTPVPTGTVTVESSAGPTAGTTLCTVTLSSGSGSCRPTDQEFNSGSYSLVAYYGGDTSYRLSDSSASPQSFTVTGDSLTTMTLELGGTHIQYGENPGISLQANLKPSTSGSPTGTVTFETTTGITVCTATVADEEGDCTMSSTVLNAGSYELVAYYSGDDNFSAADTTGSPQSYTVNAVTSTLQLTESAPTAAYGDDSAVTFTATASPKWTGTPTGTVTVADSGGTTLCTITLASGTGSCTMPAGLLVPGAYQVSASYGGDVNFAGSDSAASSLTITDATSSASLKLSAGTPTFGHEQSERLSVLVKSSYPGAVGGKVTVRAKAARGRPVVLCVMRLKSGKGRCTLAAKALKAGTYRLTATYGGSPAIVTAVSPGKELTVRK